MNEWLTNILRIHKLDTRLFLICEKFCAGSFFWNQPINQDVDVLGTTLEVEAELYCQIESDHKSDVDSDQMLKNKDIYPTPRIGLSDRPYHMT